MAYRIDLTKSAIKELEHLSAKIHDKIIQHFVELEQNPRTSGAEKLPGIDAYKLRVGNYRIIFEINDTEKVVRIVMIDDRKQVYQRLRRKK